MAVGRTLQKMRTKLKNVATGTPITLNTEHGLKMLINQKAIIGSPEPRNMVTYIIEYS